VHACRARPLPDYSRLAAAGVYHHNAANSNTSVLQLTDPQPFKLSTEVRGEVKSERAKAIIAAQEAAAAAAREVNYRCLTTMCILLKGMSLLLFMHFSISCAHCEIQESDW
jgi:ribosomal protein S11